MFTHDGRADWSRALPVVLEKHGYLAFEEQAFEEIDPAALGRCVCILLTALPAKADMHALLSLFDEPRRPMLLERPVASELQRRAGVVGSEPTPHAAFRLTGFAPELREAARRSGRELGGRLEPSRSRYVERDPSMDWSALPVPLGAEQAERWAAPSWRLERWHLEPDTVVLAEWVTEEGDRGPAMVRRGDVWACAFDLFGALANAHTSPPWEPRSFRSSGRMLAVEHVLLSVIDLLYAQAGAVRPRILPWPAGAEWVLNVRHDFDRSMTPEAVGEVLAGHARAGSAATWYWRSRHLGAGPVGRVLARTGNLAARLVAAAPRQEVALHTERLWAGGERELATVTRVVGRRPLGTSSHGDATCFRFQGAPNILWAERHEMLYTELIQHGHMHPHRFVALEADGLISILRVICLPHHESLDRSTRGGDAAVERLAGAPARFAAVGGMLQVMNHPDVNQRELFELLDAYPRELRLDWTAAEAAGWWRRSHTTDALRVKASANGGWILQSLTGVDDLAVELLSPSGEATVSVVSLAPGEPSSLPA